MEIEQIKKELEALKDGGEFTWPESDYGKAEIWRKNEMYFVWAIPMYGGIPRYFSAYRSAQAVIDEVETWT